MPVRVLFAVLLVAFNLAAQSQEALPRFLRKVQSYVEGSTSADASRYLPQDRKSQYYILDIKLDSTGGIADLSYFGKPNFVTVPAFLEKAISRIRDADLKVKTHFTRIIVPVIIAFSTDHEIYDTPFLTTKMNVSDKDTTYFAKDIVIGVFDPMRKVSRGTEGKIQTLQH